MADKDLNGKEKKLFPCRNCIKSTREYDCFSKTRHLRCIENDGWCKYEAKNCNPLPEWRKNAGGAEKSGWHK
jgi:hypothetical protein